MKDSSPTKVPLLNLPGQHFPIRDQLLKVLSDTLDSGVYILGAAVEEFERTVAGMCGTKYAVGVSSGTDALLMSLMGLGVGPGDMVITSPFSFVAAAEVIVRLGAEPVFVDVDPATFNLDPEKLGQWIHEHPGDVARVKAVIPVHLFGQCCDMPRILAILADHGIPVIEDSAQSFGACYPVETGKVFAGAGGMCGCFSFFPSKNLGALGDGGMIVTDDASFAEKMKVIRSHGARQKFTYCLTGGNFRLDAIQASVLQVKASHVGKWQSLRQKHAEYYDARLVHDQIITPQTPYGREYHAFNQYVLRLRSRRDPLKTHLAENGIESAAYYPAPLHLQECFTCCGCRKGDLPVSESLCETALAIPVFPEMTRAEQDHVIQVITGFYG